MKFVLKSKAIREDKGVCVDRMVSILYNTFPCILFTMHYICFICTLLRNGHHRFTYLMYATIEKQSTKLWVF